VYTLTVGSLLRTAGFRREALSLVNRLVFNSLLSDYAIRYNDQSVGGLLTNLQSKYMKSCT
jgi:hypothetical protein